MNEIKNEGKRKKKKRSETRIEPYVLHESENKMDR